MDKQAYLDRCDVLYDIARSYLDTDASRCIEASKKNLADPEVTPYYQILNLVLIAGASDNWEDADVFRLSAERIYDQHYAAAVEFEDEHELELLVGLREHLDELLTFKEEDMLDAGVSFGFDGAADEYDDDDASMDGGTDDIDDYNGSSDDEQAPEDAHDKTQDTDAKEFVLTVRPADLLQDSAQSAEAAEATGTANATPPPPIITVSSLRRQKSTISKGGAYNAHQFTKSIGKGGISRSNLYDMWNEEK